MGLDLYKHFEPARQIFDQIDAAAATKISALCFEGPEAELKRTINTQPTVLATSLAAWQVYQSQGGPSPDFVAGHSLGEISALVACHSLRLEDAVDLVMARATLMENCSPGAMSAILGVAQDILEDICRQATAEFKMPNAGESEEIVVVANFNTREQLVISGSPLAVKKAGEMAKTAGGKVIPLSVGGAFHSPLMVSAANKFAEVLAGVIIQSPDCMVVQNFDGRPAAEPLVIKTKLRNQMTSPVKWSNSIECMIELGVDRFVEIGPGKVLTGTIKKINRAVAVFNIYDSESLLATIQALTENSACCKN